MPSTHYPLFQEISTALRQGVKCGKAGERLRTTLRQRARRRALRRFPIIFQGHTAPARNQNSLIRPIVPRAPTAALYGLTQRQVSVRNP